MTIPHYATAMIANYRRMFHETYGYTTDLNDADIWRICNTIFNDDDVREEDEDRVHAMKSAEDGS